MFSYLGKIAAVAALAVPMVFGAPAPAHHHKIRNPEARDVVPDSYIVVYNKDVTSAVVASHVETVHSLIAKRDSTLANAGIGATYDLTGFKGYQVLADAATIGAIASSPEVNQLLFFSGIKLTR